MELSILAIRIIILIIPGAISYKLYTALVGKNNKRDWESFFEIVFTSILCYLLLGVKFSTSYELANNLLALSDSTIKYDFVEIAKATFFGVGLAIMYAYFYTYNLIYRFSARIKCTRRFGPDDLWEKFQRDNGASWVTIFDHKLDVYYFCHVASYSDTNEPRELILENVSVFDSESKKLYDAEKVYLSRNFDDLTIELLTKGERNG